MTKATVKGNRLIASMEGIIGGSSFPLKRIGAAFLARALAALMSLLQVISAALVLIPADF
ncbi:hypothetical protein [Agrobacterium tumefaciens]|uniref:hypothetical protein n=1 Tax=Agrobacterium tumefaciens TaxID=358 RepID=UPI0021CF0BC2|nr:hypothetical protein [Agrobacterium tumefaciens]UXS05506.1 hypothetical protein FY156_28645 [Agrobacterium tumefaciens]